MHNPMITKEMLTIARMSSTRIENLVSIGLLPCRYNDFMKTKGEMVAPFKGILGSARFDSKGRIVYFNKETRNGGHHTVIYEDDCIRIDNGKDWWELDKDGNTVKFGNAETYKVYDIHSPDAWKSYKTCRTADDSVIRSSVFTEVKHGNVTESFEVLLKADGSQEPTPNHGRVIDDGDVVVTIRYRAETLKSRVVHENGKRIYSFDQPHPDRPAACTHYEYDDKGRLTRTMSTVRSSWFTYHENDKGEVIRVTRRTIDCTSATDGERTIFVR